MKFNVYHGNIYHGTVDSTMSDDGRLMIHIPESINQCIGNKFFHTDLIEVKE